MPIRREMRPLYPPNWPEISRRIRFERAGGRCEGCGRPHGVTIRCLPDGRWYDPERGTWRSEKGKEARWPDLVDAMKAKTTRVVLAAAHLNHRPESRRMRELRAFCPNYTAGPHRGRQRISTTTEAANGRDVMKSRIPFGITGYHTA